MTARLLAGLLVILLAAAMPARAQFAHDAITLGVLSDFSGPVRDAAGPGSQLAAELAVADAGGAVAGHPVRVIAADYQLKPDLAAATARRWYDTEGVDLILDVPVSAAALAVQEVAREKRRLFITTSSGTADFTSRFCSPYGMQWAFDTTALAVGTARAVTERGGKTWFFLTADYAFGRSLEHDAAEVVTASGGRVLGTVRHPFNAPDLTAFVLQAQASKAQIIGLANGPPDNTNAIKLGAEFGIGAGGQRMAALLALISDVHALGLQTAQGLLLTTSFYWDRDEPSRALARRFFARLGRMPTMWQAGVYSAVRHYLAAMREAGTDDALAVAARMRAMPIEDAFARNGTLRADGLMVHDLWLAEVKAPAESKYPWDYYRILATIPGGAAFPPENPETCPLLRK